MTLSRAFALLFLLISADATFGTFVLEVQPIAVYDSRWDGTAPLDPVGTHAYIPNVNGAYAPTFATRVDTIFSQCNIDVNFSTTVAFDTALSSFDYLNMVAPDDDRLLRTNTPPPADPIVENFISGLSSTAHYMFFVNSHPNTPAGGTPPDPMTGGIPATGAAGVAVTPATGGTGPMRSFMAHSNNITSANEASFLSSTLPTVLAHELAHNLSLQHVTSMTSNLMYTGAGPTGTQDVLTASQCSDIISTGLANGTVVPEPGPMLLLGSLALILGTITRFRPKSD